MRLVQNWRKAHRMATVWVGSISAAFGLLPADQQLAILAKLGVAPLDAPFWIGLAFVAARLVDQPKTRT